MASSESMVGINLEIRSNTTALGDLTSAIRELNSGVSNLTNAFSSFANLSKSAADSTNNLATANNTAYRSLSEYYDKQKAENEQLSRELTIMNEFVNTTRNMGEEGRKLLNQVAAEEDARRGATESIQQETSATESARKTTEQWIDVKQKETTATNSVSSSLKEETQAIQQNTQAKLANSEVRNPIYSEQPTGMPGSEIVARELRAQGMSSSEMIPVMKQLGVSMDEINRVLVPYIANEERLNAIATKNREAIAQEAQAVTASRMAMQQATGASEMTTEQFARMGKETEKAGTQIHSMWSQSFLFFGVAMMVNTAIQQMQMATGETNKGMQQFGKTMQEVSSGAMVGMMSMPPQFQMAGMAVGALSGLLLGLGIAAITPTEEIANLNKQLDNLAKKEELVETLQSATGATRAEAEEMMKLANESGRVAKAVKDVSNAHREMKDTEEVWNGVNRSMSEANKQAQVNVFTWERLVEGILVATVIGTGLVVVYESLKGAIGSLANFFKGFRGETQGLTDEQLRLAENSQRLADSFKVLDSALSIKGDAADKLTDISNISLETADNVLKGASKHKEFAEMLGNEERYIRDIRVEMAGMVEGTQEYNDALRAVAAEQYNFNIMLNQFNELLNLESQIDRSKKAIIDLAKEEEKYALDQGKITRDAQQKQADIEKDRLKAEREYNDERLKIALDASKSILKAVQDGEREREKITKDTIEKLGDLEMSYNDKKTDAYYSYVQKIEALQHDVTKSANEDAQKRLQIERDLQQAIADLDLQTGIKLRKAKTEHEATEIQFTADIERAKLQREAQDKLTDLERSRKNATDEYAYRRALIDEEYQHTVEINNREHGQAVARIQREARQAMEANEQRINLEIAQIQTRANEERIALDAKHKKEMQDFDDKVEKEHADFKRRMNELDIEHSKKTKNIQEMKDADKEYADAYGKLAATAYKPWIDKQNELNALRRQGLYNLGDRTAHVIQPGEPGYEPPFAMGGDFMVPSGYPNDTFRMRVSSGERVTVTPAGQTSTTNSRSIGNVTIQVNGARDPRAIAEEVRRVLNDAVWQ